VKQLLYITYRHLTTTVTVYNMLSTNVSLTVTNIQQSYYSIKQVNLWRNHSCHHQFGQLQVMEGNSSSETPIDISLQLLISLICYQQMLLWLLAMFNNVITQWNRLAYYGPIAVITSFINCKLWKETVVVKHL